MNSEGRITDAVRAIGRGELVLLPTETVYGLGADAADAAAIARVFEAKGRPRFNPLIAHVTGKEMAASFADISDLAAAMIDRFWPGPLTLVLPILDTGAICDLARAGLDTVAVRAPNHPIAQAVIAGLGRPVCAPSANRSGRPSPTTFADAIEETGASVAVALDGGPCTVGLESTVLSVLDGEVRLLRPGGLERSAIEAVVGPLANAETHARRSPGRLALHYAPDASVRLDVAAPEPGEAFLAFGPAADGPLTFNLSPRGDVREAATNLFSMLRAADRLRPRAIAVATIPALGLGEAINDRLRRAAGYIG